MVCMLHVATLGAVNVLFNVNTYKFIETWCIVLVFHCPIFWAFCCARDGVWRLLLNKENLSDALLLLEKVFQVQPYKLTSKVDFSSLHPYPGQGHWFLPVRAFFKTAPIKNSTLIFAIEIEVFVLLLSSSSVHNTVAEWMWVCKMDTWYTCGFDGV